MAKKKVYIISSSNYLQSAKLIALQCYLDGIELITWRDHFTDIKNNNANIWPIVSDMVKGADGAIALLTPDDQLIRRGARGGYGGETVYTTRDNVLFEMGLFVQALSVKRTLLLWSKDRDYCIPTDIKDLQPYHKVTYDYDFPTQEDLRIIREWLGKTILERGGVDSEQGAEPVSTKKNTSEQEKGTVENFKTEGPSDSQGEKIKTHDPPKGNDGNIEAGNKRDTASISTGRFGVDVIHKLKKTQG